MRNHWIIAEASVALILLSTHLGYASQGEISFVPSRPPHSQALDTAMPPDSLYLFRDCDFRGDTTRLAGITQTPVGAAQDLGKVYGVSAARWSLPPGVVVVLYDKPDGRGRQIPLWGKGQIDALSRRDFNDKASSWAWYYVGAPAPGQRPQQILPPRPAGAGPTDAILPEALEFYQDHDLRGTMTTIGPITQFSPNTFYGVGPAAGRMSSLRWNLPPDVIVVLYDDTRGRHPRMTLFGSGQSESVSAWDFNDKLSHWAWFDIGPSR